MAGAGLAGLRDEFMRNSKQFLRLHLPLLALSHRVLVLLPHLLLRAHIRHNLMHAELLLLPKIVLLVARIATVTSASIHKLIHIIQHLVLPYSLLTLLHEFLLALLLLRGHLLPGLVRHIYHFAPMRIIGSSRRQLVVKHYLIIVFFRRIRTSLLI